MNFTLFGTSACHLCEQAEHMLRQLDLLSECLIIDIAEDDALLQRYSIRIPVLLRSYDQAELGWPFEEHSLQAFTAYQQGD